MYKLWNWIATKFRRPDVRRNDIKRHLAVAYKLSLDEDGENAERLRRAIFNAIMISRVNDEG